MTAQELAVVEWAARVVPAGAGRTVWLLGETYRVALAGEDTGGAFALVEALAPAGSGTPPHVHHPNDETFWVLEGEATFTANGAATVARAGDVVHVPRGMLHNYHNHADVPARFLVMLTPAGFERMFLDLGTPATEGGSPPPVAPADVERLLAAAPAYGLEVAPAPGA